MPDVKPTTDRFDPNLPAVFAADDGEIIVDSRDMAAHFDKRHNNVLATIDKKVNEIKSLKSKHSPLFRENVWIDQANGQTYRAYEMGEEAFSLIALGFTGTKALRWQIDYVHAFRRMREERLDRPRMTRDDVRALLREEVLAIMRNPPQEFRAMVGGIMERSEPTKIALKIDDTYDGVIKVSGQVESVSQEVAETCYWSIRRLLIAEFECPKPSNGFSNRCSNSLRVYCAVNRKRHRKSQNNHAWEFDIAAARAWRFADNGGGKLLIEDWKADQRARNREEQERAKLEALGQGRMNLVQIKPTGQKPA